MPRAYRHLFLAGASIIAGWCGWDAISWYGSQAGPSSQSIPIRLPASPAVLAASTPETGLFFTSPTPGQYYQAPVLKTDVKFAVSGTMIRATIRQHFFNPSTQWLEGIYVFPLPEHSGVDRLHMQIGDRMVEGRMQEKSEAKNTYEQAKKQGKGASLVSSARANIFSTRVANVGPDQEIVVEIQYADRVRYTDGRYSLRFPMVVAPRYTRSQHAMTQISQTGTQNDRNAEEIVGPVHDPQAGPINPVSLTVDLNPGFEPKSIHSPYHPITVQPGSGHHRLITLAETVIPADRDFVLEWKPPSDVGPRAQLLVEEVGTDIYLHGTVFPPGPDFPNPSSRPRDLILVIDVSGSMAGTSLTQVKQAVKTVFSRLNSENRFNLVTFASTTTQLFPEAKAATESNIDTAMRFVEHLEANGGTELLPALEAALSKNEDHLRFRQVVVLTDGAIGYEKQVLTSIAERLGQSRLFMVGMGSAPNGLVMREAASLGRGAFTYIGDAKEARERMLALLRKLERPAVTDLNFQWPPHLTAETFVHQPEQYPALIPDLYFGDPITVDVKFSNLKTVYLTGTLRMTGRIGMMPWELEIPLEHIDTVPGVAKLWAREKIRQLRKDARHGDLSREQAKQKIVSVALTHHLVTTHTSLVAVDQKHIKPPQAQRIMHWLETNLPAGWKFDSINKGTPLPTWLLHQRHRRHGPVMPLVPAPALVALALPQSATAAQLHLLLGFMGLCLFGAGYYLRCQSQRYGKRHDKND